MTDTAVTLRETPTLYDVSRLAGASIATVSRVFSGKTKVSQATSQRVMQAAANLGYEPSHAARALAGKKTHTLGAILPEIASGFYADVLAGIDEVAAENGFDILASFAGKRRSRAELIKRLLRQGRVDSLILVNLDDSVDIDPRSVSHLPIVVVDREISGSTLPVVALDNGGGAEAMIDHLFEQGHRRMLIIAGPEGNYDSEQRVLGCRKAFARLRLPAENQSFIRGGFTVDSGVAAARAMLLSGAPLPDAVFCLNDSMAIGVLSELQRTGRTVPGDVALAGYDNTEAAEHLQLTSVASPMRLMGQIAARYAIDLINGAEKPASHRLQVRLVARHSSSGRATRHSLPEAAIDTARTNAIE